MTEIRWSDWLVRGTKYCVYSAALGAAAALISAHVYLLHCQNRYSELSQPVSETEIRQAIETINARRAGVTMISVKAPAVETQAPLKLPRPTPS